MAQIVSQSALVAHRPLREFVRHCLQTAGLTEGDAARVAESLVESNLRGIDSHGVARLPHYLNRIRHGSINPQPQIRIARLAPSLARLDGDHGLGQLAMQAATTEAIALAREAGTGWVALEHSTHCGALAFYGLQIARANMLGLVFTHSDSMVVPFAAKHPFCGTNPLCLAAPGPGDDALCLDMATSIVPWNTVANAAIEGVELPADWAVDSDGEPTTDPDKVRGLHPFGGYKGSGLGLMIDVFCTFLLSSPYGPDIPAMYGDPSARRLLGGLVGAIDIARFRPADSFRRNVADLMRRWNEQSRGDPATPVLYPGEPEQMTRRRRLAEGIPLGVKLIAIFQEIARQRGIPWTTA